MNADTVQKLSKLATSIQTALVDKATHGGEAKRDNVKAIQRVREFAVAAHEAGVTPDQGRRLVAAALTKGKVNENTARPYTTATAGYLYALADNLPIMSGHGAKGDKAMTAPRAQAITADKEATPEEREARKAEADLNEVRKDIAARLREVGDIAYLRELLESLPKVEADTRSQADKDADARAAKAEAEEKALLAELQALPAPEAAPAPAEAQAA